MKLKVLNIEGKETGREISVSDKIFKSDPNDHVVYLAVKQYMATIDRVLTRLNLDLRLLEVLEK